jgi:nicotinamide-nucleotide amidase
MKKLYIVGNLRYRWGLIEELLRRGEWSEIKFIDGVEEIDRREPPNRRVIISEEPGKGYTPDQLELLFEQLGEPQTIPIYIFDREDLSFLNPILPYYTVSKGEGNFWEVRVPALSLSDAQRLLQAHRKIVVGELFQYLVHRLPPKKVGIAESCTGGRLASYFTLVSGASRIFDGGMITYSNKIKEGWLGVKGETLEKFGAVSAETVTEMVEGIWAKTKADFGVGISGIAGPTGGTPEKPVGTVYIGVGNRYQIWVEKYLFKGSRGYIQHQSAITAAGMLIQFGELYGVLKEALSTPGLPL